MAENETPNKSAATTPMKVTGPASYFPSIEKRYGQPIAYWQALIRSSRLTKHMQLVNMLKTDHGIGHGHANALVHYTRSEDDKERQ